MSANMTININEELQTLRTKIEAFTLDEPGAALTFTQRLARENNWDVAFATRVTAEYKRFVFLCAISPHQISPSEEVDQAWHMHMTYTESYWNGLCGEVLGKPLHHHPTRGGPEEREKFFALYQQTLDLYKEQFLEDPPADIWPSPEKRFSHTDFIRIDKGAHWIISKPRAKAAIVRIISINLVSVIFCIVSGNWVFLLITGIATFIWALPVRASASTGGGVDAGCGFFFGSDSGSACGSGCGGDGGCGGGCGGGCS